MPKKIVEKLHKDVVAILRRPETRARFDTPGAVPTADTTPEAYGQRLKADYEGYGKLIKDIGIEPQ